MLWHNYFRNFTRITDLDSAGILLHVGCVNGQVCIYFLLPVLTIFILPTVIQKVILATTFLLKRKTQQYLLETPWLVHTSSNNCSSF
jgi:hypothetical protein